MGLCLKKISPEYAVPLKTISSRNKNIINDSCPLLFMAIEVRLSAREETKLVFKRGVEELSVLVVDSFLNLKKGQEIDCRPQAGTPYCFNGTKIVPGYYKIIRADDPAVTISAKGVLTQI